MSVYDLFMFIVIVGAATACVLILIGGHLGLSKVLVFLRAYVTERWGFFLFGTLLGIGGTFFVLVS